MSSYDNTSQPSFFIWEEFHSFSHESSGTMVDGFCFTCAALYMMDRGQLGLRRIRVAEQVYNKLQLLSLRHCIPESVQHSILESSVQLMLHHSSHSQKNNETKQVERLVEVLVDCHSIFLDSNPNLLHDYIGRVYQGMIETSWSQSKWWLSMLCSWFNFGVSVSQFVVLDTAGDWTRLVNHLLSGLHFPDEEIKTSILYILLKLVQYVEDDDYLYNVFNTTVNNNKEISVINLVFQSLIRSETVDFQQNIVALLNLITQKSFFVHLELNMRIVCDALVCVMLSDMELIQVYVIQILKRVCSVSTSHIQQFVQSDLPDFVFEALNSDSSSVILSILSFLDIIMDSGSCSTGTLGMFLLGFLKYGADIIITAVRLTTDERLQTEYMRILYKGLERSLSLSKEEGDDIYVAAELKQNIDGLAGNMVSLASHIIGKGFLEATCATLGVLQVLLDNYQDVSESASDLEAIVRGSTDIVAYCFMDHSTHTIQEQGDFLIIRYLELIGSFCERMNLVSKEAIREACELIIDSLYPRYIDSDEISVLTALFSVQARLFDFDQQFLEYLVAKKLLSKTLSILQWCEDSELNQRVLKVLSRIVLRYCHSHILESCIEDQLNTLNWSEGASITGFQTSSIVGNGQMEMIVTLSYLLLSLEGNVPEAWIPNFELAMKNLGESPSSTVIPNSLLYLCYLFIVSSHSTTEYEIVWTLTCIGNIARSGGSHGDCISDTQWNSIFAWILAQGINHIQHWFESLLDNIDDTSWITCRLKAVQDTSMHFPQLLVMAVRGCNNRSDRLKKVLGIVCECCQASRELSFQVVSLGLHSLLQPLLTAEVLTNDTNNISDTYRHLISTLTITSLTIEYRTCPVYQICRALLKTISARPEEVAELLPTINLLSILLYYSSNQKTDNISQIRLMFNDSVNSNLLSQMAKSFLGNSKYLERSGTVISVTQLLRIICRIHINSLVTVELKMSVVQQMIELDSPYAQIMVIMLVSDLVQTKLPILTFDSREMMDYIYRLQSVLATGEESVRLAAARCLKTLYHNLGEEFKELIVHECWNSMILNLLIDESELSGIIQLSHLEYLELLTKGTEFELDLSCWIHRSNLLKASFLERLISYSFHCTNERDVKTAEKCIKILTRIRFCGTLREHSELLGQLNQVEMLIQELWQHKQEFSSKEEVVDDLTLFPHEDTCCPKFILLPSADGVDKLTVIESLLNE